MLGTQGYHAGGIPGALAGAVTGVLGPELLADPEAQMLLARLADKANNLRPAVGATAQLTRGKQ
jgi:hypothetical protein